MYVHAIPNWACIKCRLKLIHKTFFTSKIASEHESNCCNIENTIWINLAPVIETHAIRLIEHLNQAQLKLLFFFSFHCAYFLVRWKMSRLIERKTTEKTNFDFVFCHYNSFDHSFIYLFPFLRNMLSPYFRFKYALKPLKLINNVICTFVQFVIYNFRKADFVSATNLDIDAYGYKTLWNKIANDLMRREYCAILCSAMLRVLFIFQGKPQHYNVCSRQLLLTRFFPHRIHTPEHFSNCFFFLWFLIMTTWLSSYL